MKEENYRNIRLGAFVIAGTVLMIAAFYLIGNKQNLFGSTFTISAKFYNVNGLMKGNNVRFSGIDVGTVSSVVIENDSTVRVTMVLESDVKQFIKRNAVASVGSDGLMGNKLVNINSAKIAGPPVSEGDELLSRRPLEMDEMARTLDVTNDNIKAITTDLREITGKISSKNSLWNILLDTVVAANVKSAVVNLKVITGKGVLITGNLQDVSNDLKTGKGLIGALITDTTLSGRVRQTIVKLHKLSDTAYIVTGNLAEVIRNLKNGKGSLGVLLKDTALVHNLNQSVLSIDTAAVKFGDNMDALKHTWPLKNYYKKKKKK